MKLKLLFFALLISLVSFAQIPAGYYNSATGTGYTLKTQLYNIIAPHTEVSYTPGLWNLYYTSDVRADGKVWDIYSNCNFIFGTFAATGGNQDNGTGGTVECDKYNREHTFPKSWFASATPMYSDAFHVMPTDKKDNSMRGNMPYGKVGTSTFTTSNGSKIGNCIAPNTPASLTVFEPADQYKGDIARNYFYMATCYQNLIGSWQNNDANGAKVLDGSNDKVYQQWYLDLMYAWHIADPVSTKETDRNNAVYAVQGNRNPYIDHPEWVQAVWGASLGNNKTIDGLLANISVYPNPSKSNKISIETESELDEIQLVNINGQIVQKIVHPKANQKVYTLENLKQGVYFLKLNSSDKSTTKKIIIN